MHSAGLQSAGSFGNGLRSAFAQSASAALDLKAEPSGLLPDIPRGFSQGFALAPSIDPADAKSGLAGHASLRLHAWRGMLKGRPFFYAKVPCESILIRPGSGLKASGLQLKISANCSVGIHPGSCGSGCFQQHDALPVHGRDFRDLPQCTQHPGVCTHAVAAQLAPLHTPLI